MKIKYLSAVLLAAILLSVIPFSLLFTLNASAAESFGSITECAVDQKNGSVKISGSIKHSVLVSNRTSKIAVYRFDPWEDVEDMISDAAPLASADMSIRFEFELPCRTILHRMSLYAVAIVDENGEVSIISPPCYPDAETSGTAGTGFKSVLTSDVAGAVASHAGSAVIDIYLDRLDNGNKSGLIFNADGELFYFDRDIIKELDRKVLTYTASATDVYFRFLISPHASDLPFCSDGNTWASNKSVIVDDISGLNAIYAYTYFLMSRYDGEAFGRVKGIILGRGADIPILYNHASLISDNYNEAYARSLCLIGLAAVEAAGDREISLVVPVSDLLTPEGEVYSKNFLYKVAEYTEAHTDLTFTVMPESRHNPYKLSDANFSTEIDPDDTDDADGITEEIISPPETTEQVQTSAPDTTEVQSLVITEMLGTDDMTDTVSVETENVTSEEVITEELPPERPKPTINKDTDGYFCTDNIDVFVSMFNKLKREHSSVNKNFAWSWSPSVDSAESALAVCYSYNYMKLASLGADMYTVCFEDELEDKFSSISHLFKYIDTADNIAETEYAREAFGLTDWSELISGCDNGVGVYNTLYENSLEPNILGYSGSFVYLDCTEGRGTGGWFEGMYCTSLGIKLSGKTNALVAEMDLDIAGNNQAEIGYILPQSEPLFLGDALTFDVKCGEDDGSLYELTVSVYSESGTVVSKTVITGGAECSLSADVSKRDKTAAVTSVKISLKRLTGSGSCALSLYRISINSNSLTDADIDREFDVLRDYLHADASVETTVDIRKLVFGIVILASFGIAAFALAYGNDRRRNGEESSEERYQDKGDTR